MEHKLISAALQSRQHYNVLDKCSIQDSLGPQGKLVWDIIADYYSIDPDCNTCDRDSIKDRVIRKYERHKDTFTKYLEEVNGTEVSVPNLLKDIKEVKAHSLGMEIAARLINKQDASQLLQEYMSINEQDILLESTEEERQVYHLYNISECINDIANGIKLYPSSLNNVVGGGLQKGHHVVIYGRPEAGKSLFAINFTYGFCNQGLKVLYLSNEDPKESMGERFLARFTELTRYDMQQLDPSEVMEIAISRGYDKLYFAPLSPGTPKEIYNIIDKYGPFDCLIVDQLRNLNVGGESRVLQLEKAATEIRYIAKSRQLLAVSVTQAGDSAEGNLILGMSDVDFSKTGISAMADVMLGIGCNKEYDSLEQRMVTFCKNKITGEHASTPVGVNRAISKVEDI